MTEQEKAGPSNRFPRIIGRKHELERFDRYLKDWGKRHVLYYWANGGYGKTRLLEELQEMVKEAGPGYFSGGIIDLYHTASHGSSDVERLIIDNVMRSGNLTGDKYFTNYHRERELYETIRERGADPGELEKKRTLLSKVFIDDFRVLAVDARKIVLCFDTMELIQYENSTIEEIIGMDQFDPRIRGWLLDKLPQLSNVLIVFAGRPKGGIFQKRLEEDMHRAFGETLEVIQLPPLSKAETLEFFQHLPNGEGVLTGEGVFRNDEPHSPNYLPLIYLLTGGRPILLHFIYDLLRILSDQPRDVYAMLDGYQPLLVKYQNVPVEQLTDNEDLQKARQEVETQILRSIFNSPEMGGELEMIAFLPKGVDSEILQCVLGKQKEDADQLIERMKKLSFVKTYISETSGTASIQTQEHRLFFHDEMYRLMNDPLLTPHFWLKEGVYSNSIIKNFYNEHIKTLEQKIKLAEESEDKAVRIRLRETLFKLYTERLYYLLVWHSVTGYAEYKRLTALANAERSTGFAMRVRDEFLRIYNQDLRRAQFEKKGITQERVIRDSMQLWMERYHWGGFYDKAIDLGKKVLDDPKRFYIDIDKRPSDLGVLGNICALWARARAMKYGFEADVLRKTQEVLALLRALDDCDETALLAQGRLATSVGYLARWGGFFDLACDENSAALASFRELNAYPEEQAIALNNLAYVYAKRGEVELARIFGQNAVELNQKVGSRYTLGLTYTNLAAVERIARTNYTRSVDYALLALDLFKDIEDFHGLVRSYFNLGCGWCEIAQEQIRENHPVPAIKHLETAEQNISEGLTTAKNGDLAAEIPGLTVELGKIYRAFGPAYRLLGENEKSLEYSRMAIEKFTEALEKGKWSKIEQADIKEDIAETLFDMGDLIGASKQLETVRKSLSAEINDAEQLEGPVPNWYYLPLGKVERLSSQIAMEENRPEEAMYGFATAYTCFDMFSPDTVDKTQMLEKVFRQYLKEKPFMEQEDLMRKLEKRVAQQNCLINGVNVTPFIKKLKILTAIR